MYKFRDTSGRVIYVGKAKSLRSRLNSYFSDITGLHPRTARMVTTAASVEWTVVTTEVEALQLEYNWIKEFDPRFNVRYRDDKSYPELAVTIGEEYPRLQVMRGPHKKGVRYFGPYAHAWAIRETLDLLLRVFPARTCSTGVFRRSTQIGRPCLLGYIGKCSAPCTGRVSVEEHREIVEAFCDFMAGKADPLIKRLDREMTAAAQNLEFERAARLRDDLGAVRRAVEKQAVVFGDGTDADVVGLAADDLLASVQVFHVRGGRVRGQRGWIVDVDPEGEWDRAEEPTPGSAEALAAAGSSPGPGSQVRARLVENFLLQFYGQRALDDPSDREGDRAAIVPREILVPVLPPDLAEVGEWLTELRGSRVNLRVAQRGDKRALAETVTRNAAEALAQHRLKRASDLTARSEALTELQDTLGMDVAPLRIECIDISHVQGTDVVASLVVFEDGLPKRSDYRKFAIRDRPGDDVASIAEVVRRRFWRTAHRADAPEGANALAAGEYGDPSAGAAGSGSPAWQPPAESPADGSTSPGPARQADAASFDQPPTSDAVVAAGPPRSLSSASAGPGSGELSGEEFAPPPGIDPETGRVRRFAYPPQLLVVDGGAPQVNAAAAVLAELNIADVAVCGLAKRLEEVWLPGQDDPVIFPRTSESLYLLQRLRDEAHRFAITYHRAKRSKSMTVSALDNVSGLGRARRAALVKHFGSVAALRRAGEDEIAAVPGFGPRTAATIWAALHPGGDSESPAGTPAVDEGAAGSPEAAENAMDQPNPAAPAETWTTSVESPRGGDRPEPAGSTDTPTAPVDSRFGVDSPEPTASTEAGSAAMTSSAGAEAGSAVHFATHGTRALRGDAMGHNQSRGEPVPAGGHPARWTPDGGSD